MTLAAATFTSGVHGIFFHVPSTVRLVKMVPVYLVKCFFPRQVSEDRIPDPSREFLRDGKRPRR